ncbi:3-hydroxydecanoyl-ACP dehydratase [Paraferrimonas haliotis]|uniref:Thioester dehydrase n=1 Tax=Paraferrimonas haliotis TaxID=2013866 RepID=A0AA37WW92_9GAMM|nr:3-hydroxydecanoyl-ACP dehydratase [Paraferrimonas haliotis]GLS83162.1 thioester dehydrase [Paraferrimonas haliotis]
MTEANYPPIEALLPHSAPMILLDEVLDCNEQEICCGVTISEQGVFYDVHKQGVAAHVGIEFMAQAIGAAAGIKALSTDKPIQVGLLLGGRRYQDQGKVYPLGAVLKVYAKQVMLDEHMGVYQCRIEYQGEVVASAQLNTYRPSQQMLETLKTPA